MYAIMMDGGQHQGRLFGDYKVLSGTCRRTAHRQCIKGLPSSYLRDADATVLGAKYLTLIAALKKIAAWLGRSAMAHERLFIECPDQEFLDLPQNGVPDEDSQHLHEEAVELIAAFKHTVYKSVPEDDLRAHLNE